MDPAPAIGSWDRYTQDTAQVVCWLLGDSDHEQDAARRSLRSVTRLKLVAAGRWTEGVQMPDATRHALDRSIATATRFSEWVLHQRGDYRVPAAVSQAAPPPDVLETKDLLFIQRMFPTRTAASTVIPGLSSTTSHETTRGLGDNPIPAPVDVTAEYPIIVHPALAIFCLISDMHEARAQLRCVWDKYRRHEIDLITADATTEVAVGIISDMGEAIKHQVTRRFPDTCLHHFGLHLGLLLTYLATGTFVGATDLLDMVGFAAVQATMEQTIRFPATCELSTWTMRDFSLLLIAAAKVPEGAQDLNKHLPRDFQQLLDDFCLVSRLVQQANQFPNADCPLAATYLNPLLYSFRLSKNTESVPTATVAMCAVLCDIHGTQGVLPHAYADTKRLWQTTFSLKRQLPSASGPSTRQKIFHHHPVLTGVIRFALGARQRLTASRRPRSPNQDSPSIIELLSDATQRLPEGAMHNTLHSRVIAILATKHNHASEQANLSVAWFIEALSSAIGRESPTLFCMHPQSPAAAPLRSPDTSRTTVINQGIPPT
ncbi:uncharacterized protein LY79DRAFT_71654 [Colletotrichum navitas]|uniref:DUF6604 domain-containing protein n=1 Tax=Colletotrichum navitas TaxID=681940 RepID=A0AAD8PLJ7_9PEZI|nr:uncharacterized protein LY79DRAFT_71654 [Colletotrichum navitas]KAK1569632.1 hypothetical protein LY79DRAFT_71654 [Colletotrichum navitas]